MKEPERARELAELCVRLGEQGGRATGALIADMSQPLADAVGNAIEVREAIEVLRGERAGRFTDLCIALAGHMATLAGVAEDADAGREQAARALAGGAALERFRRFVEAQGGDPRIVDDASLLPQPAVTYDVRARRRGRLAQVDAEAIGRAAAGVGAGRQRKEDAIDLAVGIDVLCEIGDEAEPDTVVARVLAADQGAAEQAGEALLAALTWSEEPVEPPPLIHAVVGWLGRAGTVSGWISARSAAPASRSPHSASAR
jgi:pyrimidine-nucleoside phosphorylase